MAEAEISQLKNTARLSFMTALFGFQVSHNKRFWKSLERIPRFAARLWGRASAKITQDFIWNESPRWGLGYWHDVPAQYSFWHTTKNVNVVSNKKSLLRITTKFLLFCCEVIIIFLTSQLLRSFFRFSETFKKETFQLRYLTFRRTIFVPEASLKGSLRWEALLKKLHLYFFCYAWFQ